MRELEAIKLRSKEERLEYYFKFIYHGVSREALDLTEEDVRNYQLMKEREVSMRPGEKHKIVVQTVIKKLLKEEGFKCKGNTWRKELADGELYIYMKTGRFCSMGNGSYFHFKIYFRNTEEKTAAIDTRGSLTNFVFLPYCGFLSPISSGYDYRIDGYRNYLPSDMPAEEICAQIQRDFEDHILPALRNVKVKEDWQKLYKEKCGRYEEKDVCLLRYYSTASTLSCVESNLTGLIEMKRSCELTEEDIKSHFDWLSSIVKQDSDDPYAFDRTVNFILRSLKQDH